MPTSAAGSGIGASINTEHEDMGIRATRERRRSQRVPLTFHIKVSGIGLNGIPYCDHAVASDVSERGCQIHVTREVKPGDLLTIRMARQENPISDQEDPFLYQTIWVETTDNGSGWIAGLSALDSGNPWNISFPQESLAQP
jgi:PilZ domain